MILHAVEQGEGPPLVLLHGLFGSARNFGAIQRRLAARFRVLALDLRDHGDSPHGPIAGYADLAADVLATMAARAALPARLVGHSMGGKVAMRLALDRPQAVARLVVADIAPVAYGSYFGAYAAAMAALPVGPALTRAAAEAALRDAVPDRAVRLFLLQNLRLGPEAGWRIGLDHIRAALPAIEAWDAPEDAVFAGPALFIAGGRSDYILPASRAAIRRHFPAARMATLKHAGHWLHADDPDGFAGLLEAFLSG